MWSADGWAPDIFPSSINLCLIYHPIDWLRKIGKSVGAQTKMGNNSKVEWIAVCNNMVNTNANVHTRVCMQLRCAYVWVLYALCVFVSRLMTLSSFVDVTNNWLYETAWRTHMRRSLSSPSSHSMTTLISFSFGCSFAHATHASVAMHESAHVISSFFFTDEYSVWIHGVNYGCAMKQNIKKFNIRYWRGNTVMSS